MIRLIELTRKVIQDVQTVTSNPINADILVGTLSGQTREQQQLFLNVMGYNERQQQTLLNAVAERARNSAENAVGSSVPQQPQGGGGGIFSRFHR